MKFCSFFLSAVLASSVPMMADDSDAMLAKCLADAQNNYNTCMEHAGSVIPYKTAYNEGKCYSTFVKDRCDCFNAAEARDEKGGGDELGANAGEIVIPQVRMTTRSTE